jgi:hypothetical protein
MKKMSSIPPTFIMMKVSNNKGEECIYKFDHNVLLLNKPFELNDLLEKLLIKLGQSVS